MGNVVLDNDQESITLCNLGVLRSDLGVAIMMSKLGNKGGDGDEDGTAEKKDVPLHFLPALGIQIWPRAGRVDWARKGAWISSQSENLATKFRIRVHGYLQNQIWGQNGGKEKVPQKKVHGFLQNPKRGKS